MLVFDLASCDEFDVELEEDSEEDEEDSDDELDDYSEEDVDELSSLELELFVSESEDSSMTSLLRFGDWTGFFFLREAPGVEEFLSLRFCDAATVAFAFDVLDVFSAAADMLVANCFRWSIDMNICNIRRNIVRFTIFAC